MSDEERKYMRVPKEHAEMVMGKLADAGLIDEDAEVRWEGDYVSFPLISSVSSKND
jgi:tRNA G37 N-methylase Trm5